jgi:hypothetical protein
MHMHTSRSTTTKIAGAVMTGSTHTPGRFRCRPEQHATGMPILQVLSAGVAHILGEVSGHEIEVVEDGFSVLSPSP